MTPETIDLIRYGMDATFWLVLTWIIGRAVMSIATFLITVSKM